jgi:enoyl-CoA hydratase/carnithine racemase
VVAAVNGHAIAGGCVIAPAASHLVLTAALLNPPQAQSIGLIDHIKPPDSLLDASVGHAQRMARVGWSRAIVNAVVTYAPPYQYRISFLGLVEMKGRPSVRRGEIPGEREDLGVSEPVDPQPRRPGR